MNLEREPGVAREPVFQSSDQVRNRMGSPISDFTKGHFEEVIDDNFATKSKVRRVIICSGKVFYDLRKEQEKRTIKDVALVRLEQFYPFPERQLAQVLKKYPKAEVIYSFGRREQLDVDALKRLVNSISRFFDPEDQVKLQAKAENSEPIEFIRSRSAGGAYLLRSLWDRLNIETRLKKALDSRSFTAPIELPQHGE